MALTAARMCEIRCKAEEMGLELTDEHWSLIEHCMDYYRLNGTMCSLRILVRESGCDKKNAYRLFPGNPIKRVCCLTGLPMPPEC